MIGSTMLKVAVSLADICTLPTALVVCFEVFYRCCPVKITLGLSAADYHYLRSRVVCLLLLIFSTFV